MEYVYAFDWSVSQSLGLSFRRHGPLVSVLLTKWLVHCDRLGYPNSAAGKLVDSKASFLLWSVMSRA